MSDMKSLSLMTTELGTYELIRIVHLEEIRN